MIKCYDWKIFEKILTRISLTVLDKALSLRMIWEVHSVTMVCNISSWGDGIQEIALAKVLRILHLDKFWESLAESIVYRNTWLGNTIIIFVIKQICWT